jgi:hypothetical protein
MMQVVGIQELRLFHEDRLQEISPLENRPRKKAREFIAFLVNTCQ